MTNGTAVAVLLVAVLAGTGCSIKTYGVNMVGDALASGDSVYQSEEDLELVGSALPFGLKLTESLLSQSPRHPGLLLTACRGFVLYSYAYVGHRAEIAADEDLDRARELRLRARRLYLRASEYGIRGLERLQPGFRAALQSTPKAAAARIAREHAVDAVPFLYWTAAALGLAIANAADDATMLARLPEVHALLDRALGLDEAWGNGAIHEFALVLAGTPGRERDLARLQQHYERALELSEGRSAGPHVALAEALAIPTQDLETFQLLMRLALAVDPDAGPANRLATLLAQRRARWLLDRTDALFLDASPRVTRK